METAPPNNVPKREKGAEGSAIRLSSQGNRKRKPETPGARGRIPEHPGRGGRPPAPGPERKKAPQRPETRKGARRPQIRKEGAPRVPPRRPLAPTLLKKGKRRPPVSGALLSHGRYRSTIGARRLSFRVRNGSGRAPPAMAADRWAALKCLPPWGGSPRALGAAQRAKGSTVWTLFSESTLCIHSACYIHAPRSKGDAEGKSSGD